MKYPGLGVRSVGPVGNFLEGMKHLSKENSFSPISFFHLFIEESGFSMIGAHTDSLPGREWVLGVVSVWFFACSYCRNLLKFNEPLKVVGM